MSDVLNGFVEVERNYRQTLDRERDKDKLEVSVRREKLFQKAAMLGNGADHQLTEDEERELRSDLERLADTDWNVNRLAELLHLHQQVERRDAVV